MSLNTLKNKLVIPANAGIQSLLRSSFLLYVLLLILTACGSNQHASSDTGSISFKLKLSRPTTTSRAAAATSTNICTDYGIMTINANVVNSSGVEVAAEYWSCENHAGIIQNVPAGDEYTVTITGTLTGGIIAWHGEKSGVSVSAGGLPTPTGVITMTYTGNDTTLPPVVSSATPSIGATAVPVTTMITALFSEKMAASSINDSTFTLNNGATSVSGSVVYDANAQRSIFIPLNNLSYSTTYTATITKDVEDMAGNNMESDFSWSFTTESQPTTSPSAPTSIIAASGNSQNTITWDAVPAATSYNIYWSTTSGVTTATGTKISDITTTSYTQTGLTNGTTYYYIVTSTNSYGESVESYEVSSAPGSTDATPPTGSITINNNAVYTISTDVTLSLSSSSTRGISQMCISNTTTCSSWEPYTTSKSWTLTTGDGLRFVYAWFKDSAGTSNASPYLAAITLDTTSPSNTTGSDFINSGAASTNSTNVTLTLSATDNVGVTGYCAKESSATPSVSDTCWTSITSTKSYSVGVTFTMSSGDGAKTVYIWFKDAAGNISSVVSDSISLASPPSAPTGVTGTPGDGLATISWNVVSGATSYNIYWSTTSGVTKTTGVKISGGASTSYIHTGLTNDTAYYYVVTAVNNNGESEESNQVMVIPPQIPISLPKTGQTTCYDSSGNVISCTGTGQDGELQKGVAWPTPRFTDNGDSTVTDNLTGLVWTKDGNAPGPAACSPATIKTWQGAIDYVTCLNANSYLGYMDWRLPNVNELKSLVHAGQSDNSNWLNTHGFINVQSNIYWSSTTNAYYPYIAWVVYMWNGYTFYGDNKSNYYSYVWPVRSEQSGLLGNSVISLPKTGQTPCYDSSGNIIACAGTGQDGDLQQGVAWPSPRFTDNGDSTVTDNLTGLVWTKAGNAPGPVSCFPATTKTWQSALDYVICLNANSYLGYTDWRLPNINELKSLVHAGQSNTGTWLNSQGFINVQSNYYWSTTSHAYYSDRAWVVHMWDGVKDSFSKSSYDYYVWPVRSGQ